jgi:phenylalanyl-tRNA synthetase beta chain
MQQRLERSGQRSISALVDISNYVMLELGRPSHVFDLDKVQGALTVRWGKPGEQVELLNGQTVTVDEWVGVITDGRGVEALAGVMGGEATAVSLDTTNVYLEAAFWWPAAIQGRARRFGFSTDAAHRFERGVDFATTADHLEYLTRLILEICGSPQTQVGPVDDQIIALPERPPVRMRTARCRKVIGLPLSDAEMQAPLARLGLAPRELDGAIEITPPSYRFDLEREEDLIEEVARIHGFDSIVARPPLARAGMRAQPEERRRPHDLRRLLAALGYQEVVTYSFVDEQLERDFGTGEPIRLLNPIASQMSVMRTTLLGSLVAVLRHNLNHRAARVRVFELARVFARAPDVVDAPLAVAGVRQPLRVAALAYGPLHDDGWNSEKRLADFFDIKGDAEQVLSKLPVRFVPAVHPALHPGRSARIERLTGEAIGWVGELHPRLQQAHELPRAPVAFELDVEALLALDLPRFTPISRVPSIQRDLALWFPDQVTYESVMQEISHLVETEGRLQHVRDVHLFDLFRPPVGDSSKVAEAGANVLFTKEKSLAFRVVLQDTERTLNEIEADAAVEALVAGLASRFGARLRS